MRPDLLPFPAPGGSGPLPRPDLAATRPGLLGALLRHPARAVPLAFVAVILGGTLLLMLPVARAGEGSAPFLAALFTAASAVSLAGLAVVDPATYWSITGQAIILLLIQAGGFGIMTGAAMLGLLVTRRLRLTSRLVANAETRCLALGDVVSILRLVLLATLLTEAAAAVALALALRLGYGEPWGAAAWSGLFHAVSAYTNAGLSLYSDSLTRFASDPAVMGTVMLAAVLGGVGVPVLHDLRRAPLRPGRWSLHTRITLLGTAVLLLAGWIAVLFYEWRNPATLGALALPDRALGALFHASMTRSAGFNALDVAALHPETLALSAALMLIGGGSAGTAGGVKVTTFLVLGLAVWAEVRGEPDATAFGRRVPPDVQRQALTIALLAIAVVAAATLLLMTLTDLALHSALFEVVSAFATVGLSTGVTAALPPSGQVLLVVLMVLGRVGTVTVAAALALRARRNPFRYPEERPIVG